MYYRGKVTEANHGAVENRYKSVNLLVPLNSQDEIGVEKTSVEESAGFFENLSRVGTKDTIRVSFKLSRVNNEGRNEYDYNQTFYISANLK